MLCSFVDSYPITNQLSECSSYDRCPNRIANDRPYLGNGIALALDAHRRETDRCQNKRAANRLESDLVNATSNKSSNDECDPSMLSPNCH